MESLKEPLLEGSSGKGYDSLPVHAGSRRASLAGADSPPKEKLLPLLRRLFCSCSDSMRVPLVARWEMAPITKWMRYNVFPRTLLLHLVLIITVTTQVVLVDHTVRRCHNRCGLHTPAG